MTPILSHHLPPNHYHAGFGLIRKQARGAASQLSVGFASDITVAPCVRWLSLPQTILGLFGRTTTYRIHTKLGRRKFCLQGLSKKFPHSDLLNGEFPS